HLFQGAWLTGISLAEKADVHGQRVDRLQHAAQVPRARSAGGRQCAVCRARAAAQHRGDPAEQGVLDLLRADEVNVGIDAAGRDDLSFGGDDLRPRPDNDVDSGLNVRVTRLANARNQAVADADVGLYYTPVIENDGVGYYGVDGARGPADLALAHAVADDLAAAEFHFLAVDGAVFLDPDQDFSVGQTDSISDGWSVHGGVGAPGDGGCHVVSRGPVISPRNPTTRRAPE